MVTLTVTLGECVHKPLMRFFIVIDWKHVSYIDLIFWKRDFCSSSKNLMLVNEHVLIIYPSNLFSVEFSSGISTILINNLSAYSNHLLNLQACYVFSAWLWWALCLVFTNFIVCFFCFNFIRFYLLLLVWKMCLTTW